MVYFTCDACGQSLKKNQVEKHYQFQCRSCSVLSCVDCGKDFPGDSYKEHIKCISEEEKYSGVNFKPNPNANKGERKQEAWVQQVQIAIEKAKTNPKLKFVLEKVKDYPNIPRKKAKFENFLRNSLNVHNSALPTAAWEAINAEIPPVPQATVQPAEEAKKVENGEDKSAAEGSHTAETEHNEVIPEVTRKKMNKRERKEERRKLSKKEKKHKNDAVSVEQDNVAETKKKKKGKKRKVCDVEEETVETNRKGTASQDESEMSSPCSKKKKKKKHRKDHPEEENEDIEPSPDKKETDSDGEVEASQEEEEQNESIPTQKFNWETTIISLLEKADSKEISVKRLRKKVLAEYNAYGGDGKTKTQEKLLSKFNKKIKKNPRLRVLREKVKLVH